MKFANVDKKDLEKGGILKSCKIKDYIKPREKACWIDFVGGTGWRLQ